MNSLKLILVLIGVAGLLSCTQNGSLSVQSESVSAKAVSDVVSPDPLPSPVVSPDPGQVAGAGNCSNDDGEELPEMKSCAELINGKSLVSVSGGFINNLRGDYGVAGENPLRVNNIRGVLCIKDSQQVSVNNFRGRLEVIGDVDLVNNFRGDLYVTGSIKKLNNFRGHLIVSGQVLEMNNAQIEP